MKLGYIDYLNCYPFYYHMFEKEKLSNISLVPGYPSELNRMMKTGDLHMSPISSATCADISDEVYVLPNVCLSSVGYVRSVILVSKYDIEDLDQKTIGITRASHTSVVLLKILLKKYVNLEPVYTVTQPMPTLKDIDAALLIGNEAMIYQPQPGYRVYDLGELWLEKTGFPVVFAVFTVRKDALDTWCETIRTVISSYDQSITCLKTEKENLISKAALKYPDIPYDIDAYFKLLQFNFTDRLKNALAFYHDHAGNMGFVKPVTKLSYLDMDQL